MVAVSPSRISSGGSYRKVPTGIAPRAASATTPPMARAVPVSATVAACSAEAPASVAAPMASSSAWA